MIPSPQRISSIGRLVRVLDDAHRLRDVIRQNSSDTDLVEQGVAIHHMVDTPVFRIFAEPDRHSALVSAFPSLFTEDFSGQTENAEGEIEDFGDLDLPDVVPTPEDQPTLFANALLTAEYIFRNAGDSGGGRLLISPEHTVEIEGYVVNLARRATFEGRSAVASGIGYDTLGKWLSAQTAGFGERHSDADQAEWLKHVRRGLVARLAEIGVSSIVAEQRLLGVFSRGRLGHAAEALRFDASLISPPDDIIRQWRLRIRNAKRVNRVAPNAHALDADAVTLAQLQLFNERADSEKRVCVLVTSDIGLHRACRAWMREHGHEKKPLFPLRDPRQYMPVLNIGEDTGGFIDGEVFIRVKESLDQLLTSFASTDAAPGELLADGTIWPDMGELARAIRRRNVDPDQPAGSFARYIAARVTEVGKAWLRLLEYSLLAKSDVVVDLAETERRVWQNLSIAVLRREMGDQVSRVADQFRELTQSSALLRLEIRAFNQRTLPASANRRMLVSEFAGFDSAAFRTCSLPQVVDMLRRDLDASIDGLQAADSRERLLVIGCISLGIGALSVARTLFEQARRPRDADPLGVEVRFFQCVARRLAPGNDTILKEYADLEKQLPALLADGSGPLHVGRVRMETVAVLLCRVAYVAYLGKNYSLILNRALSEWRLLSEWGRGRLVTTQSEEPWRALLKQFTLNTFCLQFWADEADVPTPEILRDMGIRLLDMMEDQQCAFIKDGVHGAIYPDLARYALASKSDRHTIAIRICASIRRALEHDAQAGFAFDLPFIDKIELGFLERRLTTRHALDLTAPSGEL